jgi:hypothetical protein
VLYPCLKAMGVGQRVPELALGMGVCYRVDLGLRRSLAFRGEIR